MVKWSVCCREVVRFSEGLLLDFIADNSATPFAGRDTTPDAQKEEMEITKDNELYEVPTSCDTQKRGMNIETSETHLYEVPIPVIKIAERDTQKKKVDIKMKENVSYEAPTPENMTEVQAYGSLPNKP